LSASRMAVSYGFTMKQVWVNLSAWALMAATTLGWLWPTFITEMPPPKSMYSRPSTSRTIAPCADLTCTGVVLVTPAEMTCVLSFCSPALVVTVLI